MQAAALDSPVMGGRTLLLHMPAASQSLQAGPRPLGTRASLLTPQPTSQLLRLYPRSCK